MAITLTRIVIIEKHKENDFPKFEFTKKGLIHCKIFIDGFGGMNAIGDTDKTQTFEEGAEYSLYRANMLWEKLKRWK